MPTELLVTDTPLPQPRSAKKELHITLPGLLVDSLRTRWKEFHYSAFSPYAIELICFDLRVRRQHDVTQPFAVLSLYEQAAIDHQVIQFYRPGPERNKELIKRILRGEPWQLPARPPVEGDLKSCRAHIYLPACLVPLVEIRWPELEYPSFAAYVTGLIRYDLLLSGPHNYFNGSDTHPEILAALDAETIRTFCSRKHQRILLDYLIEDAVGKTLSDEERAGEMRKLAARIREAAVEAREANLRRARRC